MSNFYIIYILKKLEYKFNITLEKENINDSSRVYEILKNSIIKNEFFKPQFHGREHLNVRKYMNNLLNSNEYDILGLNEKTISTYKLRLLTKLNVTNLVDLVNKAKTLEIV